ncbi:MAG TPA: outer membrane protein transport protein [Polyangia bacterium]|nr:outer membrane protein transport protein [Polyangia bacterium]
MVRTTNRVVAIAIATLLSSTAWAGNMFLPARGARALGRGGAFTAGVDDGSAIYYNPGGLADIEGISVLVDGALIFQRAGYDRVDSGGNPQPHVQANMNLIPIPTLAITWQPRGIRGHRLTFAAGVWTPYLGLDTWPTNGPQRYSNITLNGSILTVAEVAMSIKITEWFRLGFGFENMFIHFNSQVALSACTQLNCAPEDQGFDARTQVDSDSWFTPSGVVGAILKFDKIRIGANLQLPFWVHSNGTVASRLPTDPFFANAAVNGNQVGVDFNLPLQLRLGVELRPIDRLRIEVDGDYEAWSMQKDFVIKPHNVYISGVPGIGNYYLNTLYLVRDLQDTFAVMVGGEFETVANRLWLRAGWIYESNATPNKAASVLTPDAARNLLTLGGALKLWNVRFDLAYAHVFFADRNVTNSQSFQLNPIQPADAVPVGNGKYTIAADVISAGLDARF